MSAKPTPYDIFSLPSPESSAAGCAHLARAKKACKEETGEDVIRNFGILVRWALGIEAGHGRKKQEGIIPINGKRRRTEEKDDIPLPVCTTCRTPTGRLHVCLHCA